MHLGIAVSQNPGYLKLRKIRAAQSISRTVIIIIVIVAIKSMILRPQQFYLFKMKFIYFL